MGMRVISGHMKQLEHRLLDSRLGCVAGQPKKHMASAKKHTLWGWTIQVHMAW